MAIRKAKSQGAVEDRRSIGVVFSLVGIAILASCFFYTASYRTDVFIVSVATPESDWPAGVVLIVVLGIVLLAAGVSLYRPSLSQGLVASGIAMALIGVFEYWWNEMLISGDGYPSPNWALTIPIAAVGVVLLVAGMLMRRRGLETTPDA